MEVTSGHPWTCQPKQQPVFPKMGWMNGQLTYSKTWKSKPSLIKMYLLLKDGLVWFFQPNGYLLVYHRRYTFPSTEFVSPDFSFHTEVDENGQPQRSTRKRRKRRRSHEAPEAPGHGGHEAEATAPAGPAFGFRCGCPGRTWNESSCVFWVLGMFKLLP